MTLTPLLAVSDLACERQGSLLFADLNFALMPGGILQIVGKNGSGKSSLLKLLSGLLLLEEGGVQRRDKTLLYLGHKLGIKLGLTVQENLQELATLHQVSEPGVLEQALEYFDLCLLASVPCAYLSAGQKQRVALARLAFFKWSLWILDEPFAHLDQDNAARVTRCIHRHCATGGGVVLSTHQALALAATQQILRLS